METIWGILADRRDIIHKNRYKVIFKTEVGPSSYATGGVDYIIDEVQNIEYAQVTIEGAYFVQTTVTDNKITVKILDSSGAEVANGTDLSGVNLKFTVVGV